MEMFFIQNPAGHFICQVIMYDDKILILGNVYGYNNTLENNNLFKYIENIFIGWLNKYPNAILLVGGDFNIILNETMDKWPPGRPNINNNNLKNFMDKFNLIDIWRVKFSHKTFTWGNKSGQSRIDFWLLSESFNKDNVEVDIISTPLTDHKAISIKIKFSDSNCFMNGSYWKLNNSLLLYDEV